jgi:hypothetical protein
MLVACLLWTGVSAAQTKRALIIGIDQYQPKGTTPHCPKDEDCTTGRFTLLGFGNLNGSVNDAESMAEVLISKKFGYPAGQVRLLLNPNPYPDPDDKSVTPPVPPPPGVVVLPAGQTTRAGILAAMQKYLVDEPQRGDTVVFYYAGHGSLQMNSLGHKLTVLVDDPDSDQGQKRIPVDSTIVPSDAWTGTMDVRDHEMTKIFNATLDKGVHLTVIFDSCHSGQITRGAHNAGRSLLFDARDVKDKSVPTAPAEHKGEGALVLSAAQQDQEAGEDETPDDPPVVHGHFTYALITALEQLPADVPAAVVFERVKAVMEGLGYVGQDPEMDASETRKGEPLLGPPGVAGARTDLAGKVWTAAVQGSFDVVGNPADIVLDIGRLSGIGVGSVFVPEKQGTNIQLTVKKLTGADRSAVAVDPATATVNAGDIFVLKSLVHAEIPSLRVWTPPANLTEKQVLAAAAEVTAANVESVSDPADEMWTDELNWDGSTWRLEHAAAPSGTGGIRIESKPTKPVELGATLTAAALKKHLKPGMKVWVNLPPSQELAAQLNLHEPSGAVEAVDSAAAAEYVLTGSLGASGPQYAWYHSSEYAAGPPVAHAADNPSAGCSTTSSYPVRSDWQPIHDEASRTEGAGNLNDAADSLAKVYVLLQTSPTADMDASVADYYQLQILRSADHSVVGADGVIKEGEEVQLVLHTDHPVDGQRFVYVYDITCQGKVSLIVQGQAYPNEGDNPDSGTQKPSAETIVLIPQATIHTPFGLETLMLLSTAKPLVDPMVLVTKGATSRGGSTAWGVDRVAYRGVPEQPEPKK